VHDGAPSVYTNEHRETKDRALARSLPGSRRSEHAIGEGRTWMRRVRYADETRKLRVVLAPDRNVPRRAVHLPLPSTGAARRRRTALACRALEKRGEYAITIGRSLPLLSGLVEKRIRRCRARCPSVGTCRKRIAGVKVSQLRGLSSQLRQTGSRKPRTSLASAAKNRQGQAQHIRQNEMEPG
jgi:hypothetical protein